MGVRQLAATIAMLVGLGVSAPALADEAEVHTFHCWMSCPVGAPATNDLVVREIYTLSSNDETKFADWVAYRITPETIAPSRTRNWQPDWWLAEAETLEPEDYTGANAALQVDRGHQAPLAAFSGSPHWNDTNILSNITPQRSDLNRGPWERLEARERNLVQTETIPVYVLTGPLYERPMPPLPKADEPHRVPSGYWKVVATEQGALAVFAMDQTTPRNANFCTHQTTLADVEARTGLRFFPRLAARDFTSLAARLGCP